MGIFLLVVLMVDVNMNVLGSLRFKGGDSDTNQLQLLISSVNTQYY